MRHRNIARHVDRHPRRGGKSGTSCHPERNEGSRRNAEIPRCVRDDSLRCVFYGRGLLLLLVPLLLLLLLLDDGGGAAGREPCDDEAGGDDEGGGDILGDEPEELPRESDEGALRVSPLLREG